MREIIDYISFVVIEDFICCFRGSLLICIALELMGLSHALIKKEEFIDYTRELHGDALVLVHR